MANKVWGCEPPAGSCMHCKLYEGEGGEATKCHTHKLLNVVMKIKCIKIYDNGMKKKQDRMWKQVLGKQHVWLTWPTGNSQPKHLPGCISALVVVCNWSDRESGFKAERLVSACWFRGRGWGAKVPWTLWAVSSSCRRPSSGASALIQRLARAAASGAKSHCASAWWIEMTVFLLLLLLLLILNPTPLCVIYFHGRCAKRLIMSQ